ncbi:hypothetical protein IC611_14965 [Proteus mirabilis]
MIKQTGSDDIPIYRPYTGNNGLPIRFKPEQSSSPMYKEVMEKRQQSVKEVQDKREREEALDKSRSEFDERRQNIREQYKEAHNERVNKFNNYFSWDKN